MQILHSLSIRTEAVSKATSGAFSISPQDPSTSSPSPAPAPTPALLCELSSLPTVLRAGWELVLPAPLLCSVSTILCTPSSEPGRSWSCPHPLHFFPWALQVPPELLHWHVHCCLCHQGTEARRRKALAPCRACLCGAGQGPRLPPRRPAQPQRSCHCHWDESAFQRIL